jgi:hypothetical protein
VAEPDNLEVLLAPYCPPQPGTIAARICVRMLPVVLLRYQRFFGQSGAALSIACNDVIRERERLDEDAGGPAGRPGTACSTRIPALRGESEYCYDFGYADDAGIDPGMGLRVLPAGSYACLDFHNEWPRFRSMYEDWLDKQTLWRLDSTRPHIQMVERDASYAIAAAAGAAGWRCRSRSADAPAPPYQVKSSGILKSA